MVYLQIQKQDIHIITNLNMLETSSLNRIKAALADRRKTSRWLAGELGKSETTVSRWVSNKVQPSIEQLFEIANALNMDVKELLVSNNQGE